MEANPKDNTQVPTPKKRSAISIVLRLIPIGIVFIIYSRFIINNISDMIKNPQYYISMLGSFTLIYLVVCISAGILAYLTINYNSVNRTLPIKILFVVNSFIVYGAFVVIVLVSQLKFQ